jgi:hypothetical protein
VDDEPTDDELQASLDALSGTPGQDRLRTAGLMVVSLLPGGAQLVTFLGESIRTAHARRMEETIELMAEELRRLADRVDVHLRDETWAETFIDVVEESRRRVTIHWPQRCSSSTMRPSRTWPAATRAGVESGFTSPTVSTHPSIVESASRIPGVRWCAVTMPT